MTNQKKVIFIFVDVLVVVVVVVFVVLLVTIVLVLAGLGVVAEQRRTQFWIVCGLFRVSSKATSNRTEHNSFA